MKSKTVNECLLTPFLKPLWFGVYLAFGLAMNQQKSQVILFFDYFSLKDITTCSTPLKINNFSGLKCCWSIIFVWGWLNSAGWLLSTLLGLEGGWGQITRKVPQENTKQKVYITIQFIYLYIKCHGGQFLYVKDL